MRSSRSKLTIHLVWAGVVLLPFAAWLLVLGFSELPPGQCSGIGWGCSLAGLDAVGFALVVFGPFVLALLAVGHGVIGFVYRRRDRAVAPTEP